MALYESECLRAVVATHSSSPPVRMNDGFNVKRFECLEKHYTIIRYVITVLKSLKSQSDEKYGYPC